MEEICISCVNGKSTKEGEGFRKGKMLNSEELINSIKVVFVASSSEKVTWV